MLPILNNLPKKKTPSYWKSLKKELIKACKHTHLTKPHLSKEDNQLLEAIRLETSLHNRDNCTRTKAYLDFFMDYKEIHWSLLAHMVSRNAGWSMTDLKGEYLPTILSSSKQKDFFLFLEKGNWLIFQDVYPQLLLYKHSKIQSSYLFHLLPHLQVSKFMEVIWNWYWKTQDASLLTSALIINEQNYIDTRMIQNQYYKESVLNTLPFHLQNVLTTNTILFPMNDGENVRLIGATVQHFSQLSERIKLGKHLYQLLFSKDTTLKSILDWSLQHRHTGSRKDYWAHLFHSIKEGIPGEKRVLNNCKVRSGPRIYSPELSIWKTISHQTQDHPDWFSSEDCIKYLIPSQNDSSGDVQRIHCRTLEVLENLP
ncbi:DUF2515 family protein [Alkalihalobacillus sp. R86527]|uniref:DUF2515 family protein n=1 Tax=Alkalihalobacillus sp. R86527 TaxID=3093863 RepID=UPI003670CA65